jgi:tetratricopeptide (TPR) repeat protein
MTFKESDLLKARFYFEQGLKLITKNEFANAEAQLRMAYEILPTRPSILINLSSVLIELNRHDEAIFLCLKVISNDENNIEALLNLGICYANKGDKQAALEFFDKCLLIDKNNASAWCNKANLLQSLNHFDEALYCYSKALLYKPHFEEALIGRSNLFNSLKKYEQAIEDIDLAISINPRNKKAQWNKSLDLLRLGKFEEGWKLYEARWSIPGISESFIQLPAHLWLGKESLINKNILIYAEQGFGDTIQFCRYLPILESQYSAKVIFAVPPTLIKLMQTLSPTIDVIDITSLQQKKFHQKIDFYTPIMSLPLAFGTTLQSIPNNTPYLGITSSQKDLWKTKLLNNATKFAGLGQPNQVNVGISWFGSGKYAAEKNKKRDIPLEEITPLFEANFNLNVCFHILQPALDEKIKSQINEIKNLCFYENQIRDFSDTAGLINALDFVISVDTAVAHLAGALSKKSIVMLPDPPDFMSLTVGNSSPWYPESMYLLRQKIAGNWPIAELIQKTSSFISELKYLSNQ